LDQFEKEALKAAQRQAPGEHLIKFFRKHLCSCMWLGVYGGSEGCKRSRNGREVGSPNGPH
jgi:hypothetical protein